MSELLVSDAILKTKREFREAAERILVSIGDYLDPAKSTHLTTEKRLEFASIEYRRMMKALKARNFL